MVGDQVGLVNKMLRRSRVPIVGTLVDALCIYYGYGGNSVIIITKSVGVRYEELPKVQN